MYIFKYVYILDNLFSFNSSMNIFINKNSGEKIVHTQFSLQILKTYSEITPTLKLIGGKNAGLWSALTDPRLSRLVWPQSPKRVEGK